MPGNYIYMYLYSTFPTTILHTCYFQESYMYRSGQLMAKYYTHNEPFQRGIYTVGQLHSY